jgi:membrane protease YdiL (CAAX protease family)
LSAAAITSWLLGLRWYGAAGMGLRGGRPLTAGIGFASLLWIIFLLLRIFFVFIAPTALESRPPDAGRTYIYLLLFEAFATQLWTYGLIFRSVADWRGPITATMVSGIVFGLIAILFFQEFYDSGPAAYIYFIVWGVLYGLIRLRSGSLLGSVIVQSVQSFTTWVVLAPYPEPDAGQLNNLYLTATIAYMIVAWRLWPKSESDYRI